MDTLPKTTKVVSGGNSVLFLPKEIIDEIKYFYKTIFKHQTKIFTSTLKWDQ